MNFTELGFPISNLLFVRPTKFYQHTIVGLCDSRVYSGHGLLTKEHDRLDARNGTSIQYFKPLVSGKLTGYGGGLKNKERLLALEGYRFRT